MSYLLDQGPSHFYLAFQEQRAEERRKAQQERKKRSQSAEPSHPLEHEVEPASRSRSSRPRPLAGRVPLPPLTGLQGEDGLPGACQPFSSKLEVCPER